MNDWENPDHPLRGIAFTRDADGNPTDEGLYSEVLDETGMDDVLDYSTPEGRASAAAFFDAPVAKAASTAIASLRKLRR